MPEIMTTAEAIITVCSDVQEMLLAKNKAYGDSAVNPVRVFSKVDSLEQLNVRIDDKLSRIARGLAAGEDAEWDLIGYLILKRAAIRKLRRKRLGGVTRRIASLNKRG